MSGESGQIVSAGSATGSIYDLGYRRYTGARLGRRHALASLIRHSFRQAFGLGRSGRAKIIPIGLAVLAALPAVVALGVTALANQLGTGDLEEASPVRYDTYYVVIAQTVALFTAAQAPELLGRDLRYRVLALYFTRALRRDDYALAKVVALGAAMLLVILLPQLIIFIGRALVSVDIPAAIADDLPRLPPMAAQALLTAALLATLGLAIASFSPRRVFATIAIIAALIIPPIVTAVADQIAGRDIAGVLTLFSPADVLVGSNAFFFDGSTADLTGRMPTWAYPIAGVVMTATSLVVLLWRYRRIEP
jgi:ABC-2 type transport system permease protein